jgi:hypothetical protein
MKTKVRVFEILRAKDYYINSGIRKQLLGWVVFMDYHLAFSGNKKECRLYIKRFSKEKDIIYGL